MKVCNFHREYYRNNCAKCINAEKTQVRLEQELREEAKKEAAKSKEKTKGFLSRMFCRSKDKKREKEDLSPTSSKNNTCS